MRPLLSAFCEGRIDNAQFHHAQHVEVAFELLQALPFCEAVGRFGAGLRRIAAGSGRPELYNETITVGFLSLIAEARGEATSFEAFAAQAPQVMRRDALGAWYSPERLGSDLARRAFLMPDRLGALS
jgi:hypothetical protein